MKKIILLIPALLLAGCASPESGSSGSGYSSISNSEAYEEGSEEAKKALASLRKVGHRATIDNDVRVLRYDGAVSTHIHVSSDIAHGYGEDRAYKEQITTEYYDVDFEQNASGEWEIVSEELNSSNSTIPAYYFADSETGVLVREDLNAQNEVDYTIMGNYDDTSLVYTAYSFEELFKNPWDYIRSSDITKDDEGKLHLDIEKANFLVDCYTENNLNAVNFVSDCLINVDEAGAISSLLITTPDQVAENLYRRISTLTITYHDLGTTEIAHLSPKTNENPGLERALQSLVGKTNFSFDREITVTTPSDDGETVSVRHNHAYFSEDIVYFHQLLADYPDYSDTHNHALYTVGDDYDYKVEKESDGLYHVYGYKYNATVGWTWTAESLNGTTLYTIDTFAGIGPSFHNVSSAVFESKGNHVYEVVEEARPYIGSYFDNGFEGVHSSILDGGTQKCIVTLNDEETMIETVELSFKLLTQTYDIKLTLMDVGTTVIPSWL